MKILKPALLIVMSIFFIASCDIFKPKDDYESLLKKVEVNKSFEMQPPIATNVFFQELEEPDTRGNNIKLVAEFEKGAIQGEYLALMLNDEKIVLRDDGKGADAVKGDNRFSINLKEDINELQSEFLQRQKSGFTKENTITFVNRSQQSISTEELRRFNFQQLKKGELLKLPPGIFKGPLLLTDPEKTLMVRSTAVVEDPSRTFNPCTSSGNPNGVWTFGHLMRQMASPNPGAIANDLQVSDFVRKFLNSWSANQTVNGEGLQARTAIQNLISDWENKSASAPGGVLKMQFAPFKLIAIVNRLDLRGNSGYGFSNAGEGRFVFNALTSNCSPMQFTVIFEYGVNKKSCSAVKAYAKQWSDLNNLALGSPAYNAALENITKQFTLCGTNISKPNQNSINQIRSNDRGIGTPWELREFNLKPNGQLELVDVKQEPQVKYNGFHPSSVDADVEKMVKWVNDNAEAIKKNNYEVPLNFPNTSIAFRGGHSLFPGDNSGQIWNGRGNSGTQFIIDDTVRHVFSLNTCSSCHGGETITGFTHIKPTGFGTQAALSGFLTGISVTDPANRPQPVATSRTFNDLLRRKIDLANLISNHCIRRPFFDLAHLLTFRPVRMVH